MKFLSFGTRSSFLLLFLTTLSFAEDVVFLSKGEVAPFSGYLLSESKEKDTRIKLLDCDLKAELLQVKDIKLGLYSENESIYKERIKELSASNEQLTQKTVDLQRSSDFMKVLYFLGGAAITTFLVFGLKHGP